MSMMCVMLAVGVMYCEPEYQEPDPYVGLSQNLSELSARIAGAAINPYAPDPYAYLEGRYHNYSRFVRPYYEVNPGSFCYNNPGRCR